MDGQLGVVLVVIVDCSIPDVSCVASSCSIVTSIAQNKGSKLADIEGWGFEYNGATDVLLRLASFPSPKTPATDASIEPSR